MDEFKKYLQSNRDQLGTELPSEQVWLGIQEAVDQPNFTLAQKAEKAPAKLVTMKSMTKWMVAAAVILLAGLVIWQLYLPSKAIDSLVKQAPLLEQAVPGQVPAIKQDALATSSSTDLKLPNKQLNENSKTFPSATPITTLHTVNELSNADEAKMEMMESSFTQVINLQKARISSTPLYAESPGYFKDFTIQMKQMEKDEKQIKIDIRKNGMNDALLDQLINVYQQKLNMLKLLQTEMQKLNTRYKQNRVAVDTVKTYYLHL